MSDPLTKDYHDVPDDELVVTFMSDLRARIAALEAENGSLRLELADLWACVRAAEALPPNGCHCPACRSLVETFEIALVRLRPYQALAAEHGLPLPGAGEAS